MLPSNFVPILLIGEYVQFAGVLESELDVLSNQQYRNEIAREHCLR